MSFNMRFNTDQPCPVMVSNSIVGYLTSRYGRKPVFLALTGFQIIVLSALLFTQILNGVFAVVLLVAWVILNVLSSAGAFALTLNMVIVDLVEPAEMFVQIRLE